MDTNLTKGSSIIALIFTCFSVSATARNTADYSIDYAAHTGVLTYQGIVMPPARFRHAPKESIEVVVSSAPGVAEECQTGESLGCYVVITKHDPIQKHAGSVCWNHGVPIICSKQWTEAGTAVSVKEKIILPRVGEIIDGVLVTSTMQDAILLHEIAHANGWSSAHER